jgi:ribosome-binding ATPase YchF (GTP1/OBG family)
MKLSVGIVGLPNVGKSLLFKILTEQDVVIANYPFATIDPNIGIVPVKDSRLDKVAETVCIKKIVPAVIEFYDIAGLVRGAHKGDGLGNQFLSKIREVSVIVHLVRCFKSEEIIHHEGKMDPIRDIRTIQSELIFKDIETVEKRLGDLRKQAKTGEKNKTKELEIVEKIYLALSDSMPASVLPEEVLKETVVKEMFLLSAKPQIYVLNGKKDDILDEIIEEIRANESEYLIINLIDSESADELIEKTYKTLGLISFFTITGGNEARAWPIKNGTNIRSAVGEIHTDFEEKFIKAEVINWEKLVEAGSWQNAKHKGRLGLEGKEYIVEDGDVIEVKHG